MQLWKREQAILQLRWNVVTVDADTTERLFLTGKRIVYKRLISDLNL